jgi:hypothetical protein
LDGKQKTALANFRLWILNEKITFLFTSKMQMLGQSISCNNTKEKINNCS